MKKRTIKKRKDVKNEKKSGSMGTNEVHQLVIERIVGGNVATERRIELLRSIAMLKL